MLSGKAPFHAHSRDDSAAAVMARIKGGEFNFNADAWSLVSAQAKYVTQGTFIFKVEGEVICHVWIVTI